MRSNITRPGSRVIAVVLCAAAPLAAAATGITFQGAARDVATGKPLYREMHFVSAPGTARETRIVHYQCPGSDAIFARKELDYAPSREMPRFTLTDARLGYVEGLRTLANGRAQVFQVPGARRSERNALLPATKSVVADAGFDEFLKRHWAELERGQSIKFAFLVPSRLHEVEFKISKHGDAVIEGAPATVIRLNLSGFLGWFLPYIDATYRKSDRALMRYQGLTNLRDAAGNNMTALIDFPAAERREQAIDLAALRAVPLVRACP
jgi:hypothetical protein